MSTSLGEYGNTYAFAHSSNMNIFLQLNIDGEDDRPWQYHTVAHELSHIFDFHMEILILGEVFRMEQHGKIFIVNMDR